MAKSSQISIGEFQRVASLSDAAMMWLLREGKLPLMVTNDQLMVDLKTLDETAVIDALFVAGKSEEGIRDPVLEERIVARVNKQLGLAIEEAFALLAKNGRIAPP